MIAYVKGTVEYTDSESVILEQNGIGYLIKTPSQLAASLSQGTKCVLYTYMYVREDVIALYGFKTREEQSTFVTLLGVSGIGPKVALALLSTLSVEELYYAVFSEDAKAIAKTPGIGPKGAKRMIIELKDKLKLEHLESFSENAETVDVSSDSSASEVQDTIDALMALGYSATDAYKAVHAVEGYQTMTADQLIKASLKYIF